ncbi:MAG: molybdopterin biosynthesis protein [Bacillota bacterium]
MDQKNASGRTVYLENIPYEDALSKFLSAYSGLRSGEESIPVKSSVGRVTSRPVFARLSSPHYHASAMDGIAVDSSVTSGARETSPILLTPGKDAFWVNTGDPLPEGTNAVIMVEDIHERGDGHLEIIAAISPWENVRVYGEDMVETELILPALWKLRPPDIGAVLAGGHNEIWVHKKPVVAIIPTGSELVPPTKDPGPGEIIDSNSSVFAAMVSEWGAEPALHPIVPDELDAIRTAAREASLSSDLILLSAGSSHGSRDFTSAAMEELGEVLVHGVATRPGKPVVLGRIGPVPAIGVPGYPVSAALALELFARPLLSRMTGILIPGRETAAAVLSRSIVSPMGVDEFVRVKLGKVGPTLVATPISRGAALTTSLVRSDGVVVVPRGREGLAAGKEVEVTLHRPLNEVLGQVVAIGSHDVTLDLISNMLRTLHPDMTLSSANQGSLGGLMALRRGEAHIAGTHLLDETTGEYNVPFIKKYLAGLDVRLITLSYRLQGFMVKPGNPKGIREVEDLLRPGVQFVNRQKGSGTRVLLDYALRKKGLCGADISGYEREEYTHTQVAAAVKSGAADVGLGVLSAARALGLEFVPWRKERYDLCIPAQYMDHPGVAAVIQIIRSGEFKSQVELLGGYDLEDTGKVQWPL